MMNSATSVLAIFAVFALALPEASARDPKGSPDFERSYSSAVSKAKSKGKPLVVIFTASWCGPCQNNKHNVYPSRSVKPYHDDFVWAYLDVDKKANKELAKAYGVRGIPHIEFVSPAGRRIDKSVGDMSASRFASLLKSVLRRVYR